MKFLLGILLCLMACSKPEEATEIAERKFDPMTGASGQVIQVASSDFNVSWDTTWNCSQTLVNWDDKGASKYYILIQGSGNGSCPNTYTVDGTTYYYPWTTYNTDNSIALLSGQICGTLPLNNYNMIIRYYEFKQGKWLEYNSTPVSIPLGSNSCNN